MGPVSRSRVELVMPTNPPVSCRYRLVVPQTTRLPHPYIVQSRSLPPPATSAAHSTDKTSSNRHVTSSGNASTSDIPPLLQSNTPASGEDSGGRRKLVRFDADSTSSASGESGQARHDEQDPDLEDDGKIPRPKGEAGRPGRGGYNLKATLSWSDAKFENVRKYINSLVEKHLDCMAPLSEQLDRKVQAVHDEAISKYDFLNNYRDCWVINDFIKTRLKSRKQHLKQKSGEEAKAELAKRDKAK